MERYWGRGMASRWWQTGVAALAGLVVVGGLGVASASAKTTVVFWHAMGGPLGQTLDQLVQQFNQSQNEIEVKAMNQGNYGALQQKLLAAVAARKAPTMSQVYSNWTDELISGNQIVPIENFIKGPNGLSQAEFDDILPGFRRGNTFYGKFYTMPFNKSLYVTVYNKTLYDQKGLGEPRTWNDLLRAAQATTERQGDTVARYGFGIRPNVDTFALFFLTNGGDWLSDDLRTAQFNSVAGQQALQLLVDMVHKWKVAYILSGYLDQDFGAGKVATYTTSSPGLTYAEQAVGNKFTMAVCGLPYNKTQATPVAGTDLAIMAQADPREQEAAWAFIKWLTAAPQTARWSAETSYLPVRTSAIESPAYQEFLKTHPNDRVVVAQLKYAVSDPPIAEWNKIRGWVSDATDEALQQKKTPKQALDEAAAKSNELLAKRK